MSEIKYDPNYDPDVTPIERQRDNLQKVYGSNFGRSGDMLFYSTLTAALCVAITQSAKTIAEAIRRPR